MPFGLIQNKGLNVIHTVFLFSRQRSLNRMLSNASAAWCSTLGHIDYYLFFQNKQATLWVEPAIYSLAVLP